MAGPWSRRRVLAAGAATVLAGRATAADIAGDVDILRRAYGALHPGLMRYHTAGSLAAAYGRLEQDMVAAMDAGGRFLALARFTATIRCGHSYPNPFNQSKALTESLLRPARLPFAFRWIEGGMAVTDPGGAPGLSRGDLVTSVDGRSTRRILKSLMPLARADGHNDAKRIALLEATGAERFEAFDLYFPLVFGSLGASATLKLASGRTVQVPVASGQRPGAADEDPASPWRVERLADGVTLLTMPTWALYDSPFDWRGFLDRTLDEVADGRALIVDLRGNEGGLDCGDAILGRFARRDVRPLRYRRRTRYRRTPDDLNRYLSTWDDSFRDWGADAVGPDAAGFYDLVDEPGDARVVIQPMGRPMSGKLLVLVDSACSSATFQFAQLVQSTGLGTLVGGPTGGNRRGINGGAFFFLKLPASGIEVDLPLIGRFPDTPQPDAGLSPDILAPLTAAAIAQGRDPALGAALRLARS